MNNPIKFNAIIDNHFENKDIPIYFYAMEERPKAEICISAYSTTEQGCFFISDWFYKPITRFVNIHADEP